MEEVLDCQWSGMQTWTIEAECEKRKIVKGDFALHMLLEVFQ